MSTCLLITKDSIKISNHKELTLLEDYLSINYYSAGFIKSKYSYKNKENFNGISLTKIFTVSIVLSTSKNLVSENIKIPVVFNNGNNLNSGNTQSLVIK